ncbi:MAG: putative ATP-dependent RNA helicase DHR1 [Chrysothrix sp. TS-e1954]|nr:MAG: putative ATP-dependent RNA helicase DHR1 [Chrysothrix sp. TS-e1954]
MVLPKPRQRKHKVQKRSSGQSHDSNAVELRPEARLEKHDRRRDLHPQAQAEPLSPPSSSKKKKRLEKYIDGKLKKDENHALIKKLSQQKVDTGLLKSSKKLGRGHVSRRERFEQALNERRAGISDDWHEEALYEKAGTLRTSPRPSVPGEQSHEVLPPAPPIGASSTTSVAPTQAKAVGAGLKRPLETDDAGNLVIKKRKRLVRKLRDQNETQWDGFSSEMDSPEDATDPDTLIANTDPNSFNGSSESDSDDIISEYDSSSSESTSSIEDEERYGKELASPDRVSAFKAWATQQRNEAIGFQPTTAQDLPSSMTTLSSDREKRKSGQQHRPDTDDDHVTNETRRVELPVPTKPPQDAKAFYVPVKRSSALQEERLKLPIVSEEQRIMETVRNHTCTMICGSTGSGKTTQVPQFLFEAGYGNPNGPHPGLIAVTQPRRVAAVSMAQRVAQELGDSDGKVSHQVRFDSTLSNKTAIEFITDGVLLRRISSDFTLSRYSVIVIDEAHERSLNTDLLLGMVVRIAETRQSLAEKSEQYKPLKIVIMSATVSISELCKNASLFRSGAPPIVNVEGRQYPVSMHFARNTQRDYVEHIIRKVSRGHRKLPAGGFLVFLTGQNEIETMSGRLKEEFTSTSHGVFRQARVRSSAFEAPVETDDVDFDVGTDQTEVAEGDEDSDIDVRGTDNEDNDLELDEPGKTIAQKIHVLPLYSALPNEQQMRIYEQPPNGSRMIVLATNVAETSLTIPGIRFVFDCGRSKQKRYDPITGVQSYTVDFVSKASADQRAGRAGRVMAGHCYRLYSSAVYEQYFPRHSEPEIVNTSIEGLILQLKSVGIPKVTKFPFPTPPPRENLISAERMLSYLGAVDNNDRITPHGHELALYPLSPRLSQIITLAEKEHCLEHALILASLLASPEVFTPENQLAPPTLPSGVKDELWIAADNSGSLARERSSKEYNSFHGNLSRLDRHSDAIKLLVAFSDFIDASKEGKAEDFRTFTRPKAMQEAVKLRTQLTAIVASHKPGIMSKTPSLQVSLPSATQIKLLRRIVAAGYIEQIAIRADMSPSPPTDLVKVRRPGDVPYITLFPSSEPTRKSSEDAANKYVFIHSSSVLMHIAAANLPQYIVYSHLSRAAERSVQHPTGESEMPKRLPRTRMHPLTPLSAAQIVTLTAGTPLLEESKPIGKIETLSRSQRGEERRACWVTPFLRGEQGSTGWPLPPARKVEQMRLQGKGWVTERITETKS